MENITMGQIAVAIAFIVALISGVSSLKKSIKEAISKLLDDRFKSIEKTQDDILKKIKEVDMENCKNYLVTFLAEVERGEVKDPIELERFYEEYDHYVGNHGNSYIKEKVEYLKQKGLLHHELRSSGV